MKSRTVALMVACFISVGVCHAADVVLCERGKVAKSEIVLPVNPGPSAKYAAEELQPFLDEQTILICDDISCGVVPMDKEVRAWREATGRAINALAAQADRVVRVFCGLPMVLK